MYSTCMQFSSITAEWIQDKNLVSKVGGFLRRLQFSWEEKTTRLSFFFACRWERNFWSDPDELKRIMISFPVAILNCSGLVE